MPIRMLATQWACALLVVTAASTAFAQRRVVRVAPGETIAGIRLGMSVARVRASGHTLRPEGEDRAAGVTGYYSGPILILFDARGAVQLVSVPLRESAGIRFGGVFIPPRASLTDIARQLPQCTRSAGSGGNVLTCTSPRGVMHFYDSFGQPGSVSLHLG